MVLTGRSVQTDASKNLARQRINMENSDANTCPPIYKEPMNPKTHMDTKNNRKFFLKPSEYLICEGKKYFDGFKTWGR